VPALRHVAPDTHYADNIPFRATHGRE
jgi:hypothetical protein